MNSIVAGSNWKPKVDNDIPILLTTEEEPTALLRLTLAKGFESVIWEFLQNLLKARNFPTIWIEWIYRLLHTSYSRVVVNGETLGYFKHRMGLSQDVFQQMV